ncbi:UPF0057 membrane protein [Zancudomyces culisetae]|uniref:UPF0057 membrane protein n=1 Tax=Zancudomyces culisetae TaxID=1213189 RepID=A0A1R1PD02_ZANCU|nr:UPF0057 membrane protein [Zancudomyces culisetae]|eukprot:OMH78865.1 UPF0057 membrane protein [Zancudomyces culisetae]
MAMEKQSQGILVLIALFIPPVAVYMERGDCDGQVWLNLILTIFFYLPGFIHALIVIFSRKTPQVENTLPTYNNA